MSVYNDGATYRNAVLGKPPVSKASGAFSANTRTLFNVTGGEVLITALWGVVTTAITVADTVAIQCNPSGTGDTQVIVTATDLGTTDTAAGSVVGLTNGTSAAPAFLRGGTAFLGALVTTGAIEQVTTGTNPDGAVTWYATWVPLTDGAVLAAA